MIPRIDELDAKKNATWTWRSYNPWTWRSYYERKSFIRFVHEIDSVVIRPSDVHAIQINDFEKNVSDLTAKIKEMEFEREAEKIRLKAEREAEKKRLETERKQMMQDMESQLEKQKKDAAAWLEDQMANHKKHTEE